MIRTAIAALALACALSCAHADDDKPPCETLAESRADAQKVADDNGAGLISLDDKDAHASLAKMNAIGKPTDFDADHLGIFVFVDEGRAVVVLADGPCGGYHTGVQMPLGMMMQAYQAMRGTKT